MYINRKIENVFLKYSKDYQVMLLTGLRQSGKTTMLENLIQKYKLKREIVSLDTPNIRLLALNDTDNFFKQHQPPILIDEVQNAPILFNYIKLLVDKNKKNGDFWLTGSQVFKLMDNVQESLAGRVCILQMATLSLSEIYNFKSNEFLINDEALIEKYNERKNFNNNTLLKDIFTGSMPAIISKEKKDKNKYYEDYVYTYLEKDVRYISSKIDSFKFTNFLKILASFTGQVLNVNHLSLLSETNVKTINNYLLLLERLGIIFYLHSYSNNLLKRTISKPKIYFYDTGLITYFLNFDSENDLKNYNLLGAIFENYVISEINKTYINMGKTARLYYYRDIDNNEIDLILEHKNIIHPIEIKLNSNPSNKIINNFKVLAKAKVNVGKSCIICNCNSISAPSENCLMIPYYLI